MRGAAPSSTPGTPTGAILYRRQEQIPDDLGTAVNVQAMVFGNRGATSGSGVAFTRDPATGASGVYGDYLQNAQGEDVVAGIRNTLPLADLEGIDKKSLRRAARHHGRGSRSHYRDMCDIEFTIEQRQAVDAADPGRQAHRRRPPSGSPSHLVDEGVITEDEALHAGHR